MKKKKKWSGMRLLRVFTPMKGWFDLLRPLFSAIEQIISDLNWNGNLIESTTSRSNLRNGIDALLSPSSLLSFSFSFIQYPKRCTSCINGNSEKCCFDAGELNDSEQKINIDIHTDKKKSNSSHQGALQAHSLFFLCTLLFRFASHSLNWTQVCGRITHTQYLSPFSLFHFVCHRLKRLLLWTNQMRWTVKRESERYRLAGTTHKILTPLLSIYAYNSLTEQQMKVEINMGHIRYDAQVIKFFGCNFCRFQSLVDAVYTQYEIIILYLAKPLLFYWMLEKCVVKMTEWSN